MGLRCSQAEWGAGQEQGDREGADAQSGQEWRVDRTRVVMATVALTGRRSPPTSTCYPVIGNPVIGNPEAGLGPV